MTVRTLALAGAVAAIFCPRADAVPVGEVVRFETLIDGVTTPTDNSELPITDAYELNNGVTLRFTFRDEMTQLFTAAGRFERRGAQDPGIGFISTYGTGNEDTGRSQALNDQLGLYFLRSPTVVSNTGDVGLRVDYANTTGMRYAAGEIWDIDGTSATETEQWKVDAFDSSHVLLDSVTSPLGNNENAMNSLDSRPWTFELIARADISYVQIEFVGGKTSGVGLAFNNFRTAITLPADFDEDLDVDGTDLIEWRQAFGPSALADADDDEVTNGNDFLIWQQQLGLSVLPSASSSVPEPNGLIIGGVLAGTFIAFRRTWKSQRPAADQGSAAGRRRP
jgi:hypothetical protein